MTSFPENPRTTPLTVERLRNHLFSRSAYPHWRYQWDELLFGVEVEYFVTQKGNPSHLFKKSDFEWFLHRMERFGYSCKNPANNLWYFVKETQVGYVVVKPDFVFHELEIALPPRSDLVVLTNLLKNVLQEVDSCLDELGFERLRDSFLDLKLSEMELVKIPRYEGYLNCSRERSGKNEFSQWYFPAFLAATHVHLNVSSEEDLRLMPVLYELEWLALALFDRTRHRTNTVRSLRTLYYRDSFGHDYRLVGVPERIPASLDEYVEQYNASPTLYPNDPFFPVRDYSSIRPTRFGTLEFRSACSPLEIETVRIIVAFRAVQWFYAIKYADKPLDPGGTEPHRAVMRYADPRGGQTDRSYENAMLERLEHILPETGEYGYLIQPFLSAKDG